jgi:allene oxide cyclase
MRSAMLRSGLGLVLATVLAGCGGKEDEELKTRTIRVVERATTDATTDNAPTGDSPGDVLTFGNALFDEANSQQVGTNQGYCVRIKAGESWECTWTSFFDEGQITVAGPFFDTRNSTLTITGGTGAFDNARGQMQLEFRNSQGTEFNFIYEILLDQ